MARSALLAGLAAAVLPAPLLAQCPLAELAAADGAPGDAFGAAAAFEGDRALVGAPLDADGGEQSGTAFVFERGPTGWTQQQKLAASDAAPLTRFGARVALDGDRAAVGAPGAYNSPSPGAVYVFERGPGAWLQDAKLVAQASGPTSFGSAIALDGERLLVGDGSVRAAYVYERGPDGWTLDATLEPSVGPPGGPLSDVFGAVVDLEGDRAIVGSLLASYVFERGPSGWSEVAQLSGDGAGTLGGTIALDGERVLLGSPIASAPGVAFAGAAFVFERAPSGVWTLEGTLFASDASPSAQFGQALALEGDRALVAELQSPLNPDAAAYLFERTPSGWVQTARITGATGFRAVAISGGEALLGAPTPSSVAGSATILALGPCAGLAASASTVSVVAGGSALLDVVTFPARPGDPYLVLGSASSKPGFSIDGAFVPLAIDAYFLHTLLAPNTPPLSSSLGVLDPAGLATATFLLPAGSNPSLVGIELWHAAVVLQVTPVPLVALASEAVRISLVP